ncbi:MAG: adenylate/guanylate cyclase domain-containing protein [Alphaproteobacteria bacterium]|nr:adenylate/guanylate cyclase domain-containing protein [Alphaproteobacteria bacterium]
MSRWSALPVVLVAAMVFAATRAGLLEPLELWAYDRIGAAVFRDLGDERRVTLVTLDEPALAQLGWPLGDDTVAELVARILDGGARAVALDVYRDQPRPPGTVRLDALLASSSTVVGVTFLADGAIDRVPPPAALIGSDRVGFADLPLDRDSLVRRGLLYRADGEKEAVGLALRVALVHLNADGIAPGPDAANEDWLKLGAAIYRPLESGDGGYADVDARGYQFMLDYGRRLARPPVASALAVLDGTVDPALLRGRTVLIGIAAPSTRDVFPMPAGPARATGRRSIFGVELQAAIAAQILRQAYGETAPLRVLPPAAEAGWSIGWCLIGGALGAALAGALFLALGLAGGIALLSIGSTALLWQDWWLPVMAPSAGFVVSYAATSGWRIAGDLRQRLELRRMFARFVDPGVAEEIWRQRDVLLAGGRPLPRRFEATVLVSDLAGFSAASEAMDPSAVMDWVGAYMDRMTDLVIDRGGMVEKYAGDGLLAVFGGPAAGTDADAATQARRAVDCARSMRAAVDAINRTCGEHGWPPLHVRIGIHSGPVVSGAVGSARRSQYTVIGDTPNVAARLEAFEKDKIRFGGSEGNCRILLSGTTAALLGPGVRVEKIADAAVRGREGRVEIYRLCTDPDR